MSIEVFGTSDEWVDIGDEFRPLWQNLKCPSVFKDASTAWDSEAILFWEWVDGSVMDSDVPVKMFTFTEDSKITIEFPYVRETEPIHKFKPNQTFKEEII